MSSHVEHRSYDFADPSMSCLSSPALLSTNVSFIHAKHEHNVCILIWGSLINCRYKRNFKAYSYYLSKPPDHAQSWFIVSSHQNTNASTTSCSMRRQRCIYGTCFSTNQEHTLINNNVHKSNIYRAILVVIRCFIRRAQLSTSSYADLVL